MTTTTIDELLETGRLILARELEEKNRRDQEKAGAYQAAVEACVRYILPPELHPFVHYPEMMSQSLILDMRPTVIILIPNLVPVAIGVDYRKDKTKDKAEASVWKPRCVGVSEVAGNIVTGSYDWFGLDELPYALALAEQRNQEWQQNIREQEEKDRQAAAQTIQEELTYQVAEENGSGVTLEHARGQALRDIVEEILNEILDERGL